MIADTSTLRTETGTGPDVSPALQASASSQTNLPDRPTEEFKTRLFSLLSSPVSRLRSSMDESEPLDKAERSQPQKDSGSVRTLVSTTGRGKFAEKKADQTIAFNPESAAGPGLVSPFIVTMPEKDPGVERPPSAESASLETPVPPVSPEQALGKWPTEAPTAVRSLSQQPDTPDDVARHPGRSATTKEHAGLLEANSWSPMLSSQAASDKGAPVAAAEDALVPTLNRPEIQVISEERPRENPVTLPGHPQPPGHQQVSVDVVKDTAPTEPTLPSKQPQDTPASSRLPFQIGPAYRSEQKLANHSAARLERNPFVFPGRKSAGEPVTDGFAQPVNPEMMYRKDAPPTTPNHQERIERPADSANPDLFFELDSGPDIKSGNGLTATSKTAESGFKDPELGWITVRAHTDSTGMHAALVSNSAVTSNLLGTQLPGLSTFLQERQVYLDTLSVSNGSGAAAGSAGGFAGGYEPQPQNQNQQQTAAPTKAKPDSRLKGRIEEISPNYVWAGAPFTPPISASAISVLA